MSAEKTATKEETREESAYLDESDAGSASSDDDDDQYPLLDAIESVFISEDGEAVGDSLSSIATSLDSLLKLLERSSG